MTSDLTRRFAALQPDKLALAVHQASERIRSLPSEPIAVVGMAGRFPGGANSTGEFWDLLIEGRSGITEVPASRWDIDAYYDPRPGTPGKMYTRHGGFLNDVEMFDAELFHISPREAAGMDPQQRLLLETAWTALDDAAALGEDAPLNTGVFIGVMNHDYAQLAAAVSESDSHTGSGNGMSVAAGRIAHALGLRGPTLAVDTACSSSLVALHLAASALRAGECDLALAGGVNLILAPTSTVVECQMRMLSPDGRCKAFDADADGFVRGEAVGVVVLKRLSDALRDGDRIRALVRGSAVNHDGRSAGLTVPNGQAQERVIRAALADGGVLPSQVGYVEAHGTGTALGDPIEIGALGRVYTEDRTGVLLVGSAKTNVGHTESAAGITGVIKAILALGHGQVPAHLNLSRPNPAIDWDHLPVRIPGEPTPLPASDGRRFAAVSSFGFAGTNAHVVLESAPATAAAAPVVDDGPHLLTLSAASAAGLSAAATDMASWLGRAAAARAPGSTDDLAAVCRATQVRRSHLRHRAAFTVADTDEAVRRLRAAAGGAPVETGTALGTADGTSPRVAMLFTGNGANYVGMGAGLRAMSSRAAEVLRRCEDVADALRWPGREHPLRSVIDGVDGTEGLLQRIDYAQPALYAVQCALVEAWREWGVTPAAVAGHSMGEYAAAYAAGVFGLEDGMRLALERGRCLARLPAGGMRVCFADQTRVARAISSLPEVSIAAVNSPRNVVVSGPLPDLELAAAALDDAGIESRPLDVDHAYHSPATDAVLDDFHRVASTFVFTKPTTTFVSALTAGRVDVELTGEDYWTRHIRQPVRFAAAVESLLDLEIDVLLEIGPKASLVGLARAVAAEHGRDDLTFVASLREAGGDGRSLLDAAGLLHTRGGKLDWDAIGPGGSPFADLPLPPFDRRAHWLGESGEGAQPGTAGSATTVRGTHGAVHPLLGSRLRLAGGERRYEVDLAPHRPGYLRDHVVAGQTVLPGAALVELLRAAMVEVGRDGVLRDLELRRAVVLAESGPTTVQTAVGDEGAEVFVLAGDDDWVSVASATFADAEPSPPPPAAWAGDGDLDDIDVADYYEHYAAGGLDYGPDFRSIESLASAQGRSLARLALPQGVDAAGTELHPVLLDGALQAIGAALPRGDTRLWVPAAIGEVRVERPLGSLTTARVIVEGDPADGLLVADIVLVDDSGRPAARLSRVRLQPVAAGRLGPAGPDPRSWLYDAELRPAVRRFPPVPLRLPTPDQLREAAQPLLEELLRDTSLQSHGQALDGLDELVPLLIQRAVAELGGAPDAPDAELSAAGMGIAERHHRLWPQLLRRRSPSVAPREADQEADLEAQLERLAERAPAEVGMVRRCGERLADVLAGRVDPLTLLFPDGDTDGAAALYERSAGYRAMNRLVASTLTQLLSDVDPRDGVRVLEVGAGTGATTAQALLAMPPDASEYVFTDISPHFLSRARARFAHHPQLRTAVLDISQDPQLQGEHAGRYDLVIAANVLHATPDLAASLQHVRRLLAPGGRLLLVEALATRPWLDITFGLTDGWWAFADGGIDQARAESPLLDLDGWRTALGEAGFDQVALLSPIGDDRPAQAGVIVAGTTEEPVPSSRLLLIGDDPALDQAAADCGHEVHRVADVPAAVTQLADNRFDVVIDAWPRASLADAVDPGQLAAAVEDLTRRALSLLPALTALPETDRPRWVITTRGAHGHPGGCDPTAALPLGLARALYDEVAAVDCHVVDVCDDVDATTLLREVLAPHERALVVLRDGLRLTSVLRRWPLPRTTVPGRTPSLRADGSYLITGGLTGLGLVTAGWAVARGATRLVLVGRRDPGPDALAAISRMASAGVRVDVLSADVSNADDVDRLRRHVADHPLRGIVHAAGGLSDGMLGSIDAEGFVAPLHAKVIGSGLLAGLARDAEVDFLVCYSSAVSLLGSVGQANHVIGATFQDLLARALDGSGITATSVNWGAWSQVGAAADEGTLARMAARGLGALTPEDGLAALDLVLQHPPANVAVVPIDWPTVVAGVTGVEVHPSLARIIGAEQQVAAPHTGGREDALLAALGDMAADEVGPALIDYVLATVGGVIGRALSPGDADRPLHDLGLDSLIAIDVRNRLLAGVDVEVPVEDLVGGGTPADVARTLAVRLLASAGPDAADDTTEYEEQTL
jgi:acyl transferase domain-containing protein